MSVFTAIVFVGAMVFTALWATSLLQPISRGQGYLKAGFLGFPKSGKSYTATLLACGLRDHLKASGPVAMLDTEGGSEYLAPLVRKLTGQELIGIKTRAFDDLIAGTREAEAGGVSVLVVDSVTHYWRELGNAFMARLNEQLRKQRKPTRSRMQLGDIMALKELWSPWPDLYLNAKLHIIICGRAGFEWDTEETDEGEKKLIKTGVKMKVESEFGFEPSLLVLMEREQTEGEGGHPVIKHRATVLGDRFGVIDGASALNPTFDFFAPHVRLLTPGAHTPIDTSVKSQPQVDESGDAAWSREKRQRTIFAEELQGMLVARWPGQTAAEKQAKAACLAHIFQTHSWTKISEGTPAGELKAGLECLRTLLADEAQLAAVLTPPAAAQKKGGDA